MKYGYFIFFAAVAFLASGCMPAQSKDVSELRGEVAQMQIQLKELQANHADLYARADTAFVTLDVLNASIHDLQSKNSALAQKVQELDGAVRKKDRSERGDALLPSEAYQSAYSDYSMGKYDLAYSGFQKFIEKYPDSELAAQAQFYMGESLYSQSKWKEAVAEYQKVELKYKKSDLVAAARLKMALSYDMTGDKSQAMDIFGSIVKDFPQSSEAFTAKEKIRIYNNAQKK